MTSDDAATSREPSPVAPQVPASLATPVVSSAASLGPGTLAGQVFKSPASWFQRSSTPATTSSTAKHSLLAMIPSRPLSRPSSAAPPSPARNLQPPSIPALEQAAKQAPSPDSALVSTLPALLQPAVQQQQPQQQQPELHQPQQQQQQQHLVDTDKQDEAIVEHGSPTLALQTQPEVDQQAASKKARRDKRIQKTAASMHWQLMKRLAEISTDVEMLNHEVARIKHDQSTALVAEDQKDLSEQEEQQLEALHQKRFQDLITRQCAAVLKSVQAHKWAFPFARPVDFSIFKDYPIIIRQPMDFGSIKTKVEGGRYQQPQQFHDDMKLVFANARRYNPPGSDVNLMANGVEEKFDERWQALLLPKLAEEDMHARTDEAAVRKQRLEKAQVRQAGELEQQRLRLGSAFEGLHNAILDAKSLAAAACKPVSHRHKEALIPALESLTAEQFEWAMSLVHARYPGLPSGPGEEMQFDITCLDSLALRQLMDLTQACAKAAQSAEDAHVIWPANPVGVGSKGHKPAPNKRPRRSPTPPPEIVPAHLAAQSAPVAPTPTALLQSVPALSVSQQAHITPAMPQQTGPGLQQPAQLGQQHRTHSPQPAAQQPRADSLPPSAQYQRTASPQPAAQQPRPDSQQPVAQAPLQPTASGQQPGSSPVTAHPARQVHPQVQPSIAKQSPLVSSNRTQSALQLPRVAQTGSTLLQPSSTTQQHSASHTLPDTAPGQAAIPSLAQALPSPAVQTAPRLGPSLSQPISLAHLAALNSAQGSVLSQNAPAPFPASLAAAAAAAGVSAAAPLAIPSAAPPDPAAGGKALPDLKVHSTSRQAPLAAANPPAGEAAPAQQAVFSPQLHHNVAQVKQSAGDAGQPPSKRVKLAQEPSAMQATGQDSGEQHLDQHATALQSHAQSHMAQKQQPQQHSQGEVQVITRGSPSTLQPASQQVASSQPGPVVTSVPGGSRASHQTARTSLDQQQPQPRQSKSVSAEPVLPQPSAAAVSEPSDLQQEVSPHAAEPIVEHVSSDTKFSSEAGASSTPSQDSEEENSEEEEAEESQYRARSKSQAGKGRKAHAADAKQETRQSQRKPTPSRKGSAAAAAAAAGRGGGAAGRRGSRGRASTPSARAAPKPQRTTSRKTAGKRRRSPS